MYACSFTHTRTHAYTHGHTHTCHAHEAIRRSPPPSSPPPPPPFYHSAAPTGWRSVDCSSPRSSSQDRVSTAELPAPPPAFSALTLESRHSHRRRLSVVGFLAGNTSSTLGTGSHPSCNASGTRFDTSCTVGKTKACNGHPSLWCTHSATLRYDKDGTAISPTQWR